MPEQIQWGVCLNQANMGGFRLVGGKWMAVVAGLVVKRFWPMRHSRLAVNARVISGHAPAEVAQWREMARLRPPFLSNMKKNAD